MMLLLREEDETGEESHRLLKEHSVSEEKPWGLSKIKLHHRFYCVIVIKVQTLLKNEENTTWAPLG